MNILWEVHRQHVKKGSQSRQSTSCKSKSPAVLDQHEMVVMEVDLWLRQSMMVKNPNTQKDATNLFDERQTEFLKRQKEISLIDRPEKSKMVFMMFDA